MRKPKVGDKIVVTKFDGEDIEPTIRTIEEIKEEKALMKMDKPIGDNYVVEHEDWIWNDDWRFAVRKDDHLIVSRINGRDIEPTEVTSDDNEWEEVGGLIYLNRFVSSDDHDSDVLDVQGTYIVDVWEFADNPYDELINEIYTNGDAVNEKA